MSFLRSFQLGADAAETGIQAYDRSRSWADKLTERQAKQAAVKLEGERYEEKRVDDAQKMRDERQFKANEAALGRRATAEQGKLTREATANLYPSGRGGKDDIPADVKAAGENADYLRKAIHETRLKGYDVPDEAQSELDAAEDDYAAVSLRRGFDTGNAGSQARAVRRAKRVADASAVKPSTSWLDIATGGARLKTGPSATPTAAPASWKPRTGTKDGRKIKETSYGVWVDESGQAVR